VVKPLYVAHRIAAVIRKGNPEAATAYLDGYERRRSIEQAALDDLISGGSKN
jgi:hypothetical protein